MLLAIGRACWLEAHLRGRGLLGHVELQLGVQVRHLELETVPLRLGRLLPQDYQSPATGHPQDVTSLTSTTNNFPHLPIALHPVLVPLTA